mmetsp:Transcript_8722/g.21165  ORF Transcript_8722/g.21165 Transcript_8722/m.21165 type:complete len:219 (-) Transcript_8722:828-1484(-)
MQLQTHTQSRSVLYTLFFRFSCFLLSAFSSFFRRRSLLRLRFRPLFRPRRPFSGIFLVAFLPHPRQRVPGCAAPQGHHSRRREVAPGLSRLGSRLPAPVGATCSARCTLLSSTGSCSPVGSLLRTLSGAWATSTSRVVILHRGVVASHRLQLPSGLPGRHLGLVNPHTLPLHLLREEKPQEQRGDTDEKLMPGPVMRLNQSLSIATLEAEEQREQREG